MCNAWKMKIAALSLACLFVVVGCGSDDPTPSGQTDSAVVDSASSDTQVADSGMAAETSVDSSTSDAPGADAADAPSEAAADSGPETGVVCEPSGIGSHCDASNPCPTDMRCYGFGTTGYCAPLTPECGGFAGTLCASGRTCLRASGADLGYCATPPQRTCICSKTTGVDGC
jgi:hypothetical protein